MYGKIYAFVCVVLGFVILVLIGKAVNRLGKPGGSDKGGGK